jgi:hypothetical protein
MASWRRSTWAIVAWTSPLLYLAVASAGRASSGALSVAGVGLVWLIGVALITLIWIATYKVDVRANRAAAGRRIQAFRAPSSRTWAPSSRSSGRRGDVYAAGFATPDPVRLED